MGKKKVGSAAGNTRGFATTSVPSQNKIKQLEKQPEDEEAAPAKLIPNPVAPKQTRKEKQAEKNAAKPKAQGVDDDVSKVLADLARDARVAKVESEITKWRDDAAKIPAPYIAVPSKAEHVLVEFLLAHGNSDLLQLPAPDVAVNDLRAPAGRKPVPPTTTDEPKLIRDLNLVYVTLETVGFTRPQICTGMATSQSPWDLNETLHTMCLQIPGEKLPARFSDKIYHHQQSKDDKSKDSLAPAPEGKKSRGSHRGKKKKDADPPSNSEKSGGAKDLEKSKPDPNAALNASLEALDLDLLNVFDLESNPTASYPGKPTARLRDEFSLAGWTGKVPKQLLRDTMIREDRNIKIAFPDAKKPKGVSAPTGTSFRVECKVNGAPFSGPDYCRTRQEAEHYAATIALYQLSKGRPLHRMLPPSYRDVWMEFAEEKKTEESQSQLQSDSEKVAFLLQLVGNLKQEGCFKRAESRNANPSEEWDYGDANDEVGVSRSRNYDPRVNLPDRSDPGVERNRVQLPVYQHREDVVNQLRLHQVSIVSGATGSGKSTQVPQFVLEEMLSDELNGICNGGQVFCCQPRRISAMSIASRVSKEWGHKVGDTIGYSVKLENKVSSKTRLVFCTTGILLRRLESDPMLHGMSTVIVDEVHERSLDSDFMLVMLKRLLEKRNDLKVILMSATMKESEFAQFFGGAPVLSIPGRTFPVERFYVEDILKEIHFRPQNEDYMRHFMMVKRETVASGRSYWDEEATSFPEDTSPYLSGYPDRVRRALSVMDPTIINYELLEAIIRHIMTGVYDSSEDRVPGAILVFLPGMGEIKRLNSFLRDVPGCHVLPLHSSLPAKEQNQVFLPAPRGKRKVVLSTNIAETGVTIPDIVYVVDTGKAKVTSYDEKKHVTRLRETFIAQANTRQRQGRAGRVRPGFYFGCFSKHRHEHQMQEYETPEIQRVALESTCLRIKVYGFSEILATFRLFLDPPPKQRIEGAIGRLRLSRAIDENENLTPLGRFLGNLPLDVELGKMIAFGAFYGCIDAAVTMAAYLSAAVQIFETSSFLSGGGGQNVSNMPTFGIIPKDLVYGRSDLLSFYNIWREWKNRGKSGGMAKARAFCTKYGLNQRSMVILDDTRTQLVQILQSTLDWDACNVHSNQMEMAHVALLSAAFPSLMRLQGGEFTSPRGTVNVHGASIFGGESAAAAAAAVAAAGLVTAGIAVSATQASALAPAQQLTPWSSPWFCYFSCLHATQLLAFDATNVHPAAFAVTVGARVPLAVNYVARSLTLDKDGFARTRVAPKTAAHLREFHLLLHNAFEKFLADPFLRSHESIAVPVNIAQALFAASQTS